MTTAAADKYYGIVDTLHNTGVSVALPVPPDARPPPELQEPASVAEVAGSAGGGGRTLLYSCGRGHLQAAVASGEGSDFVCSLPCPIFQEGGGAAEPFVITAAATFKGETPPMGSKELPNSFPSGSYRLGWHSVFEAVVG